MTPDHVLAKMLVIENSLIDQGIRGEILDDIRNLVNKLIGMKSEGKTA
jgi:hypothetical protein